MDFCDGLVHTLASNTYSKQPGDQQFFVGNGLSRQNHLFHSTRSVITVYNRKIPDKVDLKLPGDAGLRIGIGIPALL